MVNAVEKGKRAERDFAEYLRRLGWSNAERTVSTGFKTSTREIADIGDIRGTPFTWQLKHYANDLSDQQVADMLHETEAQSLAARTICGILVQRRNGKADAGQWWCWLYADQLASLLTGSVCQVNPFLVPRISVRVRADQFVPLTLLACDLPRG